MSLPHNSNHEKSKEDLIHELEICHSRINESGNSARNVFLENENLKKEQRRNWEQYQIAIKERNEFSDAVRGLPEAIRLRTQDLVDQLMRVRQERDEANARHRDAQSQCFQLRQEMGKAKRHHCALAELIEAGARRHELKQAIAAQRHYEPWTAR